MASLNSETFVHTFARGLRVIEVMSEVTTPSTLAVLAQRTGLSRTVLRRFLLTLIEVGMADTDGKQYWLTPGVLRLGMSYLSSLPYWQEAQFALEELCATVGQSCALSVLDKGEIVYLQRQHAKRILPLSPALGSRMPAYAVSMGRVQLAGLEDGKLDAYLETADIRALTGRTIIDRAKLGSMIRRIREDGYAWGEREFDDSICGLAVPVRDLAGRVIAAINVSLASHEFDHDSAVAAFLPQLRIAASRIRAVTPAM
ncbi:IclR family transcriptional regulator domain-containing protein [Roseovarius sp. ZX-A-9]|uniref:IclR family transcriptional regulator domain-containing protein n=1 Tax=Roseovarius sp. ZX-A-9 TaxID=3014783 RepID=UPI00232D76D1|nr:IclR family transcriptional regulator C-terminal domain-containing protein [Roseovarius sp. ZX-A-9]